MLAILLLLVRISQAMRCDGQDDGCCTSSMPCNLGEGDCDKDSHCAGSLICGTDNCPWGDKDDCCMTANSNRVTLCEKSKDNSKTIGCPEGDQQIIIISALYGRMSTKICPNYIHKDVTNCGRESSLKKAKQLCDHKKSCTLSASNEMFGDPCWGVEKYLDVTYECRKESVVTYDIGLKTGSVLGAGTSANVYMYIIGEKGQTEKIVFHKSKTYSNMFVRWHLDKFEENELDVGNIIKIRIGHDNKYQYAGWYLDYVTIKLKGSKCNMTFPAYRWISSGNLETTLYPTYDKERCNLGKTRKYNIDVKTSNKHYAGTGANVFIMLYGKNTHTGFIRLKNSKTHSTPFLINNLDEFTVEARDIGDEIIKIRVAHDNTGSAAGWHLAYVTVSLAGSDCKVKFPATKWVSKGNLETKLIPTFSDNTCGKDLLTYEIDIKTGSKKSSGTDANVYIILYGNDGDTGKMLLKNAKIKRDLFERKHTDTFVGKADDLGGITRIRIGHDNKGRYAGWFLDKVVIKSKTCSWEFSGWKWLGTSRLSIDMYPTLEKCKEEKSHGGICRRDFRKVGCFRRDWDKVPDLLITDMDSTHDNYTTAMNWDDFTLGLHSLACRCRAKAVGHYKYFGIGFNAECVAGKDHSGLEEMFAKVKEDSESDGCINGEFQTCDKDAISECAGAEDYDFFYEIVE